MNRQDRLRRLFDRARAMSEGEREEFVRREGSDDPSVVDEVISLLANTNDTRSLEMIDPQLFGSPNDKISELARENRCPNAKLACQCDALTIAGIELLEFVTMLRVVHAGVR